MSADELPLPPSRRGVPMRADVARPPLSRQQIVAAGHARTLTTGTSTERFVLGLVDGLAHHGN